MTDTVTPQRELKGKNGMGVFGWLIFIGMAIVLAPLLPIYLLLKLYGLVSSGDSEQDDANTPAQSPR